MYDAEQQILYIGKAKNLKTRLSSYFRTVDNIKTKIFMSKVKNIEIIITPNENSALLLESNLIKAKKPRYNILFKDDKSFPYLLLSQHNFPRLTVYRGTINKACGKYFGPFPDATAVNFTLNLLQKIFQLRVCKDSFMSNRSRPCMLHQIKLCSAPCVDHIDKATYAFQIELAEQFLGNKGEHVVQKLTTLMDTSAANLNYEQAANYRDQISRIRKIQTKQAITNISGNYDVIALMVNNSDICINILFVRNGLVIGNKAYFPKRLDFTSSLEEILEAFVTHYYLQTEAGVIAPDKILLNMKLPHRLGIEMILREKFEHKITISHHIQGVQKQLITMAEANAINSLKTTKTLPSTTNYFECLADFIGVFNLSSTPQRLECFDVSHTMGEAEVASCVVFDENGPNKHYYRQFNIKTTNIGDDYEALREALLRRYHGLKNIPNVIIIDGGIGQLNIASKVLQSLNIENIMLIAVSKGKARKPGLEEIHIYGEPDPLILPPERKALHFIQQMRDEAHRFAITNHRKKMIKSRCKSKLENIMGIGKVKRSVLLKHFGGLTELKSAGIEDLAKVSGIGDDLAKRIYEHLHAERQ